MYRAKLFKIFLFSFLISLCFISFSFGGTIPQLINYQGTLTKADGTPVPDGQYAVVFNIYDVSTGGTPLWTETWNLSTTPIVTSNGNFNAMLGTHNPIPISFFNDHPTAYLGIKAGNDSEMLPRQRIASVAYAFTAGNGIPKGGIIMWSGAIDQIPEGWALCDGNNGTPDLRDRFIVGAGSTYAKGATGGSTTRNIGHIHATWGHILTLNEIPSHNHGVNDPGHSHYVGQLSGTNGTTRFDDAGPDSDNPRYTNSVTTGISIQNTGGGAAHDHGNTGNGGSTAQDIMPPYYALAFIMKL